MTQVQALLLIVAALLPEQVLGHDWYTKTCCGGEDCHPIASCSEITQQGVDTVWEGYHFSYGQVQPSQDDKCHVCLHKYNPFHGMDEMRPVCIYTQQGS